MSDMPRVCVTCRHFEFSPGEHDWSEVTPGWDASLYCHRGHWEYDPQETTDAEYRKIMLMALTCPDYDPVEVTP